MYGSLIFHQDQTFFHIGNLKRPWSKVSTLDVHNGQKDEADMIPRFPKLSREASRLNEAHQTHLLTLLGIHEFQENGVYIL